MPSCKTFGLAGREEVSAGAQHSRWASRAIRVDWYHEFQVYAAKGYAVLFTNPRGSTGYGQKFERGIVNEWGGKDIST
jgi:dipeptidyl aminopeptidase/acylaminoacyl peptidase